MQGGRDNGIHALEADPDTHPPSALRVHKTGIVRGQRGVRKVVQEDHRTRARRYGAQRARIRDVYRRYRRGAEGAQYTGEGGYILSNKAVSMYPSADVHRAGSRKENVTNGT